MHNSDAIQKGVAPKCAFKAMLMQIFLRFTIKTKCSD